MEWNDIRLVLALCRAGSLSGAAGALGVNYSTVLRRLNAMESDLNVRLFDRGPSGLAATEAGEAVFRTAERMDEEANDLSRSLVGRDLGLEGPIRVTAPEGITLALLMPALAQFGAAHPRVQLDLVVSSHALSLARREADVAIRVTKKPPESYFGRRVGAFRFALYASKRFWKRREHAALDDVPWLMTDDGIDFIGPLVRRRVMSKRPDVALTSANASAVLDATRRGLGVTALPRFLGDRESRLVRILSDIEPSNLSVWVLIHQDLRNTVRVRALVSHVYDALEQRRGELEGAA